jgi:hypothetical protein
MPKSCEMTDIIVLFQHTKEEEESGDCEMGASERKAEPYREHFGTRVVVRWEGLRFRLHQEAGEPLEPYLVKVYYCSGFSLLLVIPRSIIFCEVTTGRLRKKCLGPWKVTMSETYHPSQLQFRYITNNWCWICNDL